MKNAWVTMIVLVAGINLFGDYIPGKERPVLGAFDMEILSSQLGFKKVDRVDMVLTSKDGVPGYTGLWVTLDEEGVPRKVSLVVTAIEKDSICGSVRYYASLPQTDSEGRRFNIVLTDHSDRFCKDLRPIWEATVREGSGWCGTMDSAISVEGAPQPLYSTMDNLF